MTKHLWTSINLVLVLATLCSRQALAVDCTETLNPGADVGARVSAAAGGSVICLNDGSYGTVDLFGIHKTDAVTIRSTTARGASLYARVADSRTSATSCRAVPCIVTTFSSMGRVGTT
ncbi:MAG: hypothetical protein H6729_07810 [Deltaproteobacteria bacterium]|nr:hypothetical protein [Deltaproteobacteria bacterium]